MLEGQQSLGKVDWMEIGKHFVGFEYRLAAAMLFKC